MHRWILSALLLALTLGGHAARAQSVNFNLTVSGPRTVVRGHTLVFAVTGQIVSGSDQQAVTSITGVPAGATAEFTNQIRFCCVNKAYRLGDPNPVTITTSAQMTTGDYPMTIKYVADSGTTRTVVMTLKVVAPPSALAKAAFPPDVALPAVAAWEANMLNYGRTHCDADNANLLETSPWYYDGERVFFQIADYSNDTSWNACAKKFEDVYASSVNEHDGNVLFWHYFPHGLAMGYERLGSGQALQAAVSLSNNLFGKSNIIHAIPWKASREVSYALEAQLVGESLGQPRDDFFETNVETLMGMFEQWFISKTADFAQPFMVALAAEAMIQYYETSLDARVPWLLKMAADQMWTASWDPGSRSFRYYNSATNKVPAPDLNLLIAPLYGWLFQHTGDAIYRERGDEIFSGGVVGANLNGGKQFSQNYRWSAKYVEWRTSPVPGVPTPVSGLSAIVE